MNLSAYWKQIYFYLPSLLLGLLGLRHRPHPCRLIQRRFAETIKTDVAQLAAGINAHDAVKATAYDAPNILSMECGSPSTVGVEADREGFKRGFARDPFGESVSSTRL
jgi:hypothetical protein